MDQNPHFLSPDILRIANYKRLFASGTIQNIAHRNCTSIHNQIILDKPPAIKFFVERRPRVSKPFPWRWPFSPARARIRTARRIHPLSAYVHWSRGLSITTADMRVFNLVAKVNSRRYSTEQKLRVGVLLEFVWGLGLEGQNCSVEDVAFLLGPA